MLNSLTDFPRFVSTKTEGVLNDLSRSKTRSGLDILINGFSFNPSFKLIDKSSAQSPPQKKNTDQ